MILLDTHIIVWLITMPECLSKSAMIAIEEDTRNGGRPAVSAATIFEIFYLKRDGRLQTSAPDEEMLRQLRRAVDVLPITETAAMRAALLADGFYGDPMDRLIAATAAEHGLTLITRDDRIRKSGLCQTIR